jgi:PAS domain S-box-containing protein
VTISTLAETPQVALELANEHAGHAAAHPPDEAPGLCMAHLDPSLTVQQANQEFFTQFGLSSGDVCGRSFCDLVHPSAQQPLLRQFARLVQGKRHRFVSNVVALRHRDTAFATTLTGVAVRGESPDVTAIVVLLRSAQVGVAAGQAANRKHLLSEIDARILEGIAAGYSTVPLAARLYLSRQGVEYHVTGLLRKLRVPNRAALVSRAYAMGVLNVGTWPPKVVEDFIK